MNDAATAIGVPAEPDRYFTVGESRYMATPNEWVVSQLVEGDRVRVVPGGERESKKPLVFGPNQPTEPYEAIVAERAWFYDGLVLPLAQRRYAFIDSKVASAHAEFDTVIPLDRQVLAQDAR